MNRHLNALKCYNRPTITYRNATKYDTSISEIPFLIQELWPLLCCSWHCPIWPAPYRQIRVPLYNWPQLFRLFRLIYFHSPIRTILAYFYFRQYLSKSGNIARSKSCRHCCPDMSTALAVVAAKSVFMAQLRSSACVRRGVATVRILEYCHVHFMAVGISTWATIHRQQQQLQKKKKKELYNCDSRVESSNFNKRKRSPERCAS